MTQVTFENIALLLPISSFLLLLLLQFIWPRRDLIKSGFQRLYHNLLLFTFNAIIMRGLVPLTLVLVAQWAINEQVGIFNMLATEALVAIVVSVVVLDFAVYWQHVATHKIGWLWRIHKVHHADHDMDVTTAIRFHPVELLLSLVYKSAVVLLLGAPIIAIIIFELLLFIGPAFNHSNLRLPLVIDKALRLFIATPDVHRAHHSIYKSEQDTNYGFFLIWWDKLFGTYTSQPRGGHTEMRIGLTDEPDCERIEQMLLAPFVKTKN